MSDHRPDVGDEMCVPLLDGVLTDADVELFEILPFPQDRRERNVVALSLLEALGRELKIVANAVGGLLKRVEGFVERVCGVGDGVGLRLVTGRDRRGCLSMHAQSFEYPLDRGR